MAESIVYIVGLFLFVMIFALGFIMGHHQALSRPLIPVAPQRKQAPQKHEAPQMDEEERLRIEADEKAFHDCMNYNIESAYKMGGKS